MDKTQRKITKIAREVNRFTVRAMKADGVGVAELDVIHVVRKNPGVTQAQICKILSADKGAVARQTANLEAKGYICRVVNPDDGRSQLLYPTQQAQQLKNSKACIESTFYQWLTEVLDPQEQAEFARLLDVLYRRCKQESRAGFPEMTARMKERE